MWAVYYRSGNSEEWTLLGRYKTRGWAVRRQRDYAVFNGSIFSNGDEYRITWEG